MITMVNWCGYCQKKYDFIARKAKKGAVKFKPSIDARRLSVAKMSDTPGITAGKLQREWSKRVEHIYATMFGQKANPFTGDVGSLA